MSKINHLTTEQRNEKTMNLDQMTSLEIASTMNEEDEKLSMPSERFCQKSQR